MTERSITFPMIKAGNGWIERTTEVVGVRFGRFDIRGFRTVNGENWTCRDNQTGISRSYFRLDWSEVESQICEYINEILNEEENNAK